jgi:hypothetical protein
MGRLRTVRALLVEIPRHLLFEHFAALLARKRRFVVRVAQVHPQTRLVLEGGAAKLAHLGAVVVVLDVLPQAAHRELFVADGARFALVVGLVGRACAPGVESFWTNVASEGFGFGDQLRDERPLVDHLQVFVIQRFVSEAWTAFSALMGSWVWVVGQMFFVQMNIWKRLITQITVLLRVEVLFHVGFYCSGGYTTDYATIVTQLYCFSAAILLTLLFNHNFIQFYCVDFLLYRTLRQQTLITLDHVLLYSVR